MTDPSRSEQDRLARAIVVRSDQVAGVSDGRTSRWLQPGRGGWRLLVPIIAAVLLACGVAAYELRSTPRSRFLPPAAVTRIEDELVCTTNPALDGAEVCFAEELILDSRRVDAGSAPSAQIGSCILLEVNEDDAHDVRSAVRCP